MSEQPQEEAAPKAGETPQKSVAVGPPVPSDEAIEKLSLIHI